MVAIVSQVDRVKLPDAAYAYLESDRVRSSMVQAYVFFETEKTTDELVQWLAERASGIRELRQRMVRSYGDIGEPYWCESPAFDAHDHIAVVPTMSWDELRSRLAREHVIDFDRSRPLWSAEIIRHVKGIEPAGNRECVVVILRIHHGMVDGSLLTVLAKRLFSHEIGSVGVERPVTRATVTAIEAARLFIRPFMVVFDVWRMVSITRQMSKDRAAGLWNPPDFRPRISPFCKPWSGDAVSDFIFVPLGLLRSAAIEIGDVSVNDVVLAALGGATADHFRENHLVAAVPISIRDLVTHARNAVATATVDLHVDRKGAKRVSAIHDDVARERARVHLPSFAAAHQPDFLPRLPGFMYRAIFAWRRRRQGARVTPSLTQLKVSTIPHGSAEGWEFAGSPVVACFGIYPLGDWEVLNHMIYRVGDVVAIGIMADPAHIQDFDAYVKRVREEIAALTGADAHSFWKE